MRILERLTAGASVAAVACAEGLTPRRVRQIIAEALASRDVDPPAGFVPLQIGRLGDAMRVAHAKMMAGDLQAMDRVVTIVGELDRYHGFGQAETVAAPPSPGAVGAPGRRALPSAPRRPNQPSGNFPPRKPLTRHDRRRKNGAGRDPHPALRATFSRTGEGCPTSQRHGRRPNPPSGNFPP